MIAITNAKFFIEDKLIEGQTILLGDGAILAIADRSVPDGATIIDAKGAYVTPGLLDLQIYGSGGNLFSAYPSAETLAQMDDDLISKGTTGFLACVATNTAEVVSQAIAAAKDYRPQAIGFLGLHLEGPYLNSKRRGAHPEAYIKKATLEEVKRLIGDADGVVKMMTIAAELQDDDVLDYLANQDVVLSLGHSDATFEQASAAYARGFSTTTHLFNAMAPIHHRSPNLPVAVLNHQAAMASIIADGRHVDFEMVNLSHRLMGDRLFLITDAVTPCSIGPYQHLLDGDKFITPDGTLSGSNITLLQAVQNCVTHCGIALSDALKLASANPARLMDLSNTYGSLSVGNVANLLFLDENLNLAKVFVNGREYLGYKN
jgi:N-acetylglucosamine-6-phosphate deacetylase